MSKGGVRMVRVDKASVQVEVEGYTTNDSGRGWREVGVGMRGSRLEAVTVYQSSIDLRGRVGLGRGGEGAREKGGEEGIDSLGQTSCPAVRRRRYCPLPPGGDGSVGLVCKSWLKPL